jgi:uncharacterized protein YndB with AHSA1/START domain
MSQSLGIYKTRRLPFAADAVYETWIDPQVRVPPIVSMQAEVCVGGKVQIVIETGGTQSTMLGEYREVEPGRRLQYTWQWQHSDTETLVTVCFYPAGESCRLTLTHEGFATAGDREAHDLAWEAYLKQIEREVAGRTGSPKNRVQPVANP